MFSRNSKLGKLIVRLHMDVRCPKLVKQLGFTENVPAYKMTDIELAQIVEILRGWQYRSKRGMNRPMTGEHRDNAVRDVCEQMKLSVVNLSEALAILGARKVLICKIDADDPERIYEIQIVSQSFEFIQRVLSADRETRANRRLSYAAFVISVLALLVDFGTARVTESPSAPERQWRSQEPEPTVSATLETVSTAVPTMPPYIPSLDGFDGLPSMEYLGTNPPWLGKP